MFWNEHGLATILLHVSTGKVFVRELTSLNRNVLESCYASPTHTHTRRKRSTYRLIKSSGNAASRRFLSAISSSALRYTRFRTSRSSWQASWAEPGSVRICVYEKAL